MLRIASTLTQVGTALLMAAVCGGLLLALDVALTRPWAIVLTAAMVAVFIVVWYLIPMLVRREHGDQETPDNTSHGKLTP